MNENDTQGLHALGAWGWNEYFEAWRRTRLLELEEPGLRPARVVAEYRGSYRLELGDRELSGELTGALRHEAETEADRPAVGDWVLVRLAPGDGPALVRAVLPRRGALARRAAGADPGGALQVLAANVDLAFLVTSANADFNPRRLERYLALAWDGGAQPLIVLTKCDLVESARIEECRRQVEASAPGVVFLAVSAATGEGMPELAARLAPGLTAVLLGSSGVGKSTLANVLLGQARLEVGAIREHDARGRHTTTGRELLRLADGALLIDTPGMRELGLVDAGTGLNAAFADVMAHLGSCRFSDCGHSGEPDCAIEAAMASGELDAERWSAYQKLQRELAFERRRDDPGTQARERKRWKRVHAQAQAHMRRKRWDADR